MNESNFCSSRAKGKKARPVFFLALSKEKTPQKTVRPALKVGNKSLMKWPVSNETLLAGSKNENFPENLKTLLHEKIIGLIKQCCLRGTSQKLDLEDLVGECWLRIWNYRKTYDYNKAKVTTWVTWVCRSVVGLVGKKTARHYKTIILTPDDEEEKDCYREPASEDIDDSAVLSVKTAIKEIKELASKDPITKKIIEKTFNAENGHFLASASEVAQALSFPDRRTKIRTTEMNSKERKTYQKNMGLVTQTFRELVYPAFRKHCTYDDALMGLKGCAALA